MYTEQRARGPCTSQHQDKMAKSSLLVVEKRGDSSLLPAFLGSKSWLKWFYFAAPSRQCLVHHSYFISAFLLHLGE